jgi:DegV family protein with EDD domain
MPTTSQPTPAAFIEVYRNLLDQGYEIVSAHISSRLSGTVDSALQAKAHFPEARIEVIDTLTTSMAIGFPVISAARAAMQGATLAECKTIIERGCSNSGILFSLNTLEFLRRGGRIGGAQAFLGTALNLKPILEVVEGKVEAVERVRTMSKSIDRLLELFLARAGSRRPVRIAALHANSPQAASQLLERAVAKFPKEEVADAVLTDVSPVIGVHTGPGCVGLVFVAG